MKKQEHFLIHFDTLYTIHFKIESALKEIENAPLETHDDLIYKVGDAITILRSARSLIKAIKATNTPPTK
jgi:hypothetical protein